jgi:hypothetical protein
MWMSCPKREGQIDFEIEGPEPDVGLFGYSAFMQGPRDDAPSWMCRCIDWTDEEVQALETEAARRVAWEPAEPSAD